MRRRTAILAIMAAAVVASTLVSFVQYKFEAEKREVGLAHRQKIYESILHSYATSLPVGMKRAEVQDYLRARGVEFGEIGGLGPNESYSITTQIGYETGPWYCDGWEVRVAFHFTGATASADPKDILRKTSLEGLPDNCL